MIGGAAGVAFSTAADGDLRGNPADRERFARRIGIPGRWATLEQVHGADVVVADRPGPAGRFDAVFTTTAGLPVAVFTADCFGVALHADGAAGVAHAGWRGAAAAVVPALRSAMVDAGHPPTRATIGPGIGPCCFEVGPEVLGRFPEAHAQTRWGSTSVDLGMVLHDQLKDLDVRQYGACTMCSKGFFSHRANGTPSRMATVAWIT